MANNEINRYQHGQEALIAKLKSAVVIAKSITFTFSELPCYLVE